MCVMLQTDRRNRVLMVFALFCLVLSTGPQSLNLNFGLHPVPLLLLRRLCLGACLAAELYVLWRTRRQRRDATSQPKLM